MKYNQKRKLIIYMIIFVLFLVIMIFSNSIIDKIFKYPDSFYTSDFSTYESNTNIHAELYESYTQTDLLERFHVYGIAFAHQSNSNTNKKIQFILKSDRDCYTSTLNMTSTKLSNEFLTSIGFPLAHTDKSVFVADIPTIGLKQGIYTAYMYVWEDEDSYGITDLGRTFIKDATGFYEFGGKKVRDHLEDSYDRTKVVAGGIDKCEVQEDKGFIIGWGLLEAGDSTQQEIYFELENQSGVKATFQCAKTFSPLVAQRYNNPLYGKACAYIRVPLKEIPMGTLKLSIIAEENGAYTRKDAVATITFDGQTLARN